MDRKNNLEKVFVTGCSSGFGFLAAKTLAERGYHVLATMRDLESRNKGKRDELVTITRDAPGKLDVIECDVLDRGSVSRAIKDAVNIAGRIDVLVNNAGYALYGPIEHASEDAIRKQVDTNILGYVRTIQEVVPRMREQGGGKIINVGSLMGEIGLPFCGFYNATKFAVVGLSAALVGELDPFNIKVSVVEPMGFSTSFLGRSLHLTVPVDESGPYENYYRDFVENIDNLARYGKKPQEVADKIAWIIKKRNPPFRVPVGRFGNTGLKLSRISTPRSLQRFIARFHGFKVWGT